MKTIAFFAIFAISILSIAGTVKVFIEVNNIVSSVNTPKPDSNSVTIYGHRVGPDGKIVLLTSQ